jgi:hypothetical protein
VSELILGIYLVVKYGLAGRTLGIYDYVQYTCK